MMKKQYCIAWEWRFVFWKRILRGGAGARRSESGNVVPWWKRKRPTHGEWNRIGARSGNGV